MTIQQALKEARIHLQNSLSAGLDAQVLLSEILGVSQVYLLAHSEIELTTEQEANYQQWIQRRSSGEPVAYIIGRREFYDREFIVTPDVLIPRPESEHLLEAALKYLQQHPQAVVADIGTGSGALAITLAANAPQAIVYATDISPKALAVANRNAEKHQVNVHLIKGYLAQPLIDSHIKVDLLMANLPYIRSDELSHLDVHLYEPQIALDGGKDGLTFIRELLQQVPFICNTEALILLEIGAKQGKAVTRLAIETLGLLPTINILQDYAGLDRIVLIQL